MAIIQGRDIGTAARWLQAGKLVAFPTETVYGLGANARDEAAIKAVFAAKGRPADHPVIVHLADSEAASAWAAQVDKRARQLMDAFWPGPLTVVLPRHPQVSTLVTGGQDTVAIRCPSHPVARQLLQAFAHLAGPGAGVIAPSANRFGHVSPTQAKHVFQEFVGSDLEMYVLEGAPSEVGIESTIVDVSQAGQPARILRPGHIGADALQAVLREEVMPYAPQKASPDTPRVSGSLKAHYAPRTPLYLFQRAQLSRIIQAHQADRIAVVGCGPLGLLGEAAAQGLHQVRVLPADARSYAAQLYGTLRALDEQGFAALYFEIPPALPVWEAVHDRLSRAAAAF